jgi:hypothetical protein
MTKRRSRSLALLFLLLLAAIPSFAQTKNYSTNCEAARQALSIDNPNTLGPCLTSKPSAATLPALTTKQMVQEQVMGSLVDAFVKMLFSNDSQANAQKQKMMAELQARQAEAEQQHKIEEAKRLATICDRLQATLKLSGLPVLQLKQDGESFSGESLHLKLGDNDSSSAHVGAPGLPGIALNDNTGNGGSTPYGIPGLPGIYTNGPATPATAPSGNLQANASGLALKLGDSSGGSASPADPTGQNSQIPDPLTMTPQQLADLASNLPPDQQQRLVQALQSGSSAGAATAASNALPASTTNAASGSAVRLSATTTVSAAPPPTTTATLVGTRGQASAPSAQSAGASPSALGQLQGVAASSQAAAVTPGLDNAAAVARQGFDTPGNATLPTVGLSGSTVVMPSTPAATHSADASHSTPQTPAHTASSAPVINLAITSGTIAPGAVTTPPQATVASSAASCPPGVAKMILTRQQLQTELLARREQLASLRNTILRLNRSIQLDQKQFAEWQAEAEEGLKRTEKRFWSLPTQAILNAFVDRKDAYFEGLEGKKQPIPEDYYEGTIGEPTAEDYYKGRANTGGTEFDRDQLSKLNRAKELSSFSAFKSWVLEDKSNLEMVDEGIRQLADNLPSAEARSYIRFGEDLIDTAYDLADLSNTWDNVRQLDHNSTMFLEAVHRNGERMNALVNRIREIQNQLNSTPQGPSPCRNLQMESKAR